MDNNNVNNNNMKYKIIDGMVWSNEIENWTPFTDWLEYQAQELQAKIAYKYYLPCDVKSGPADLN